MKIIFLLLVFIAIFSLNIITVSAQDSDYKTREKFINIHVLLVEVNGSSIENTDYIGYNINGNISKVKSDIPKIIKELNESPLGEKEEEIEHLNNLGEKFTIVNTLTNKTYTANTFHEERELIIRELDKSIDILFDSFEIKGLTFISTNVFGDKNIECNLQIKSIL